MAPRSGHPRLFVLGACLALAAMTPAAGAQTSPPPDRPTVGAIEHTLVDAGLENVTVLPGGGIQIAYENRR